MILRIVLAGVIIVAAFGGLALLALPAYARERIAQALRDIGASDHRFTMTEVGLSGIVLDEVRLGGDGWLVARQVRIGYGVGDLLRGRVGRIEIHDAEYAIRVHHGEVDWGFAFAEPDEPGGDWPFRRIELREAQVTVEVDGQAHRLPVDGGWIATAENGRLGFEVRARPGDHDLLVAGEVRLADERISYSVKVSDAAAGDRNRVAVSGAFARSDAGPAQQGVNVQGRWQSLDLTLAGEQFPLRDLRADVQLSAIGSAIERAEGEVSIASTAIGGEDVRDLTLRLDSAGGPMATISAHGSDWRIERAAAALQPVIDHLRGATDEPFDVTWSAALSGSERLREAARQRGVSLPERIDATLAATTAIAADSLTRWRLAASDATIALSATPTLPVADPVNLRVLARGEARSDDGAFTFRVFAHVPEFTLTDRRGVAGLFPALRGVETEGRYAMDAEFIYDGETLLPLVTLRAAEAMLASADWPIAIGSASGELVFDSLQPLRTRGPQRVTVAHATTGESHITEAVLVFDLPEADVLRVDEARWAFADGGRFSAAPFRVDLQQPRIETIVVCENVDLDHWLRIISQGRADGQGRLAGDFALVWDPLMRPRLRITGGQLVAQREPGFIRTHDAQALGDLLDENNPEFAVDERLRQIKQRIVDALQDFGYTSLRIDFVPDAGGRDVTLRAQMAGRGRRGLSPQEFESLTVNLNRFSEALQDALSVTSSIDGLRQGPRQRREE